MSRIDKDKFVIYVNKKRNVVGLKIMGQEVDIPPLEFTRLNTNYLIHYLKQGVKEIDWDTEDFDVEEM